MAATVGTSGSGSPDMALVSELLEEISRHPPAVEARKLLVEHYISIGWLDAANENAKQLKKDAPRDPEVRSFLAILEKKPELPAAQPTSSTTTVASTPTRPNFSAPTSVFSGLKTSKRKNPQPTIQLPENLDETRQELTQGYRALRERAKYLLTDFLHLQALQKQADLPQSKKTHRIKAIAEQNTSTQTHRPVFVRSRARDIQARPSEALEIIILDLENTLEWSREADRADDDKARDVLVQRVRALESALPEDLKLHCELGLMHVEHENLERNYVNDETMLGDPVKEIPRANFYVTEDNYAWDMEELAQAISANGGIMRNPLSKDMFTPKDVRGILMHVHGERLRALQVEQHEMSKGVRLETIQQMELLSGILLEDQTSDALPSRRAVDEFMAYIATLPESEQKAINGLKCPAKDSHTGQAYDFTIGEAVQDAKGNKVCFHKTGDFIKQAAEYLARNNGKSPNADKCIVM